MSYIECALNAGVGSGEEQGMNNPIAVIFQYRKKTQQKVHIDVIRLFCLIILSALMISACQPTKNMPVSYQDLCGLTSEQFANMDAKSITQWIESKGIQPFEAPIPDLPDTMHSDKIEALGWVPSADTTTVWVAYLRNGWLTRISKPDIKQGPTLGQVVDGLGTPMTIYRSALQYEQVLYNVGLEYPALGISVYASGYDDRKNLLHDNQLAIYLTPSLRISRVECFKPAPIEIALQKPFFLSAESVSLEMLRLIPWSGFDVWITF